MNDRIRLAEAMGWIFPEGHMTWAVPPNHPDPPGHGNVREIPDPFTDANDCEALIHWLREQGWNVEVDWQEEQMAAGAYIHIWRSDTEQHYRDDTDAARWKECLARTALKVLSDD